MSKQALTFGDIVVNKREFYASKQAIALNLANTNITVVSDKYKTVTKYKISQSTYS